MKLWIRSQDKEVLMIINTLSIAKDEIGSIIGFGIDAKTKIVLGNYKTKERALEVLDEITDLLEQEELLHIRKSSLNNLDEMAEPKYILKPVGQPKVYKMPEE